MIHLFVILVNLLSAIMKANLIVTSVIFGIIYQFLHKYNGFYETINNVSDIGILAMMLAIGSHIDIEQLKKHVSTIILILVSTIICSITCTPVINNFFAIGWLKSFIISTGLCLSSTMTCQKILGISGRITSDYSQLALLGTIAQDFIGIACIIYIHTVCSEYNIDLLYMSLAHVVLILFLALIFYFQNTIKNIYTRFCSNINMQEYNTLAVTVILLINYLSEFCVNFGISKEVIFLFAGVLLKQLIKDNEESIISIQNLFLASIFIVSGYNMNLATTVKATYKILVLVLYISVVKFLFYYSTIYFFKRDVELSILSAILLTSFSEIIFFLLFLLNIDAEKSAIIMIATTISIFITPFLFNLCEEIFNQIRIKTFGFARRAARGYVLNISKYYLVIGINKISLCLAQQFGEKIETVIIIDNNLDKINNYKNDNFLYLDAMTKETYDTLNIHKIKDIIICTQKVEVAESICKLIRKFNKEIRIIYVSHIHHSSIIFIKNNIKTYTIKIEDMEEELEDMVKDLTNS